MPPTTEATEDKYLSASDFAKRVVNAQDNSFSSR